MKTIILTGDRPTGQLHLGHYVGSLRRRVALQDQCTQYLLIADLQALTDNADNPGKIQRNILEVALDYLAVGIDPTKSTICIQSCLPELSELTMYYMNLVTQSRLERNPTVKEEIAQKHFERDIPMGFLAYPVSQAADITAFKANLVPVGADQRPMIELTQEIVQRFNRLYNTGTLVSPEPDIPTVGRLPGIDGQAKMGKSLGNAIYLADSPEVMRQKVMSMFTDPGHLRVSDPGTVEGNVVFTYLDVFDPRQDEVAALKDHYRRGGLGDVLLKQRLIEVLETFLTPIRERRRKFAADPSEVMNLLRQGTEQARQVTSQTLSEVKHAMGIAYFT